MSPLLNTLHRAVAGCAENELGHSEYHRGYSLQSKRGVQASH